MVDVFIMYLCFLKIIEVLLIATRKSVFYEVTQHCVLVILNGHMHLDSSYAYGFVMTNLIRSWGLAKTHLRMCAQNRTHTQMWFGQSSTAYECAHMHMSSKCIWGITLIQLFSRKITTTLYHDSLGSSSFVSKRTLQPFVGCSSSALLHSWSIEFSQLWIWTESFSQMMS